MHSFWDDGCIYIVSLGWTFDWLQLLLMKRGGEIIYSGALGHHSENMIKYFEVENQDLLPCSFGHVQIQLAYFSRDQASREV